MQLSELQTKMRGTTQLRDEFKDSRGYGVNLSRWQGGPPCHQNLNPCCENIHRKRKGKIPQF